MKYDINIKEQYSVINKIYNDFIYNNVDYILKNKRERYEKQIEVMDFVDKNLISYGLKFIDFGGIRCCYQFYDKFCIKFETPSNNVLKNNFREINFLNEIQDKYECFLKMYDYDHDFYNTILCECGDVINDDVLIDKFGITTQIFFDILDNNGDINSLLHKYGIYTLNAYKFQYNLKYSNIGLYKVLREFFYILTTDIGKKIKDYKNIRNWILVKRNKEYFIVMCDYGHCI